MKIDMTTISLKLDKISEDLEGNITSRFDCFENGNTTDTWHEGIKSGEYYLATFCNSEEKLTEVIKEGQDSWSEMDFENMDFLAEGYAEDSNHDNVYDLAEKVGAYSLALQVTGIPHNFIKIDEVKKEETPEPVKEEVSEPVVKPVYYKYGDKHFNKGKKIATDILKLFPDVNDIGTWKKVANDTIDVLTIVKKKEQGAELNRRVKAILDIDYGKSIENVISDMVSSSKKKKQPSF